MEAKLTPEAKTFYPNTTQVPNFVLDEIMRKYAKSPSKFFVLMAIVRKTYGWMKVEDVLSLSQIEALTGLSKNSVKSALKGLVADGYISIVSKGEGRVASKYRCMVNEASHRGSTVDTPEGQSLIPRGSTVDTQRVNQRPPRGSTVDTQRVNQRPPRGSTIDPTKPNNTKPTIQNLREREESIKKTSDILIEDTFPPSEDIKSYIPDEKLNKTIDEWKKMVDGYKPGFYSQEKQSIRSLLREGYSIEDIQDILKSLKSIRESKIKEADFYRKNSFSLSFLVGKDGYGRMLSQLQAIVESGVVKHEEDHSYEIWDEMTDERKIEKYYCDGKWKHKESEEPEYQEDIAITDDGIVPEGSTYYPYLGIYVDKEGNVYRSVILRVKYLYSIGKGHLYKKFNMGEKKNVA